MIAAAIAPVTVEVEVAHDGSPIDRQQPVVVNTHLANQAEIGWHTGFSYVEGRVVEAIGVVGTAARVDGDPIRIRSVGRPIAPPARNRGWSSRIAARRFRHDGAPAPRRRESRFDAAEDR